MAALIDRFGPPDLSRYHANSRGLFPALLRSIVYQQISGTAAAAILARVHALFPDGTPTPEALLRMRAPRLKKAGLSVQKITYVRDLAKKCLDGTIDESRFPTMTSVEIVEHLVQVKGIGQWSAQMLLIFTLYRPDILPIGDLAIQKGFKEVYGLRALPNKRQMERIAQPWRLHATAASWYLWRVADDAKRRKAVRKK
jgi:3-methyladenine DNA glycosylase/8-oxoguanine DNA glycosylase